MEFYVNPEGTTMKFSHERRPNGVSSVVGEVLTEAMPWIKHVTGKTIVIKYGGAAMVDETLRAQVMADIVLLKIIGVNPVIVHGGGKAINAALEKEGLPIQFAPNGQRITSPEAMAVVRRVLTGEVNQELVEAMNHHGNLAVGISGADAGVIIAEPASVELGRVGNIVRINPALVEDLVAADYIPIIASIAMGEDGGCFNVNADIAAGHIAAAIGAHKIIFLSDIDGYYTDYPKDETLVACMTADEARAIAQAGANTGGMIPKLESCVRALDDGVSRAHIINGVTPHALLLELLTTKGIGTMVTGQKVPPSFDAAPLGNFAAKLLENE